MSGFRFSLLPQMIRLASLLVFGIGLLYPLQAQEPSSFEKAMRILQDRVADEEVKKDIETKIEKHRRENPPTKPEAIPEIARRNFGKPVVVNRTEPSFFELRMRIGERSSSNILAGGYTRLSLELMAGDGSGDTCSKVLIKRELRSKQSNSTYVKTVDLVKPNEAPLKRSELIYRELAPPKEIVEDEWFTLIELKSKTRGVAFFLDARVVSEADMPEDKKQQQSIFEAMKLGLPK